MAAGPSGKCTCGAEDFNAQLDALLAAIDEEMRHADRLASALYGCGMGLHAHNPHCKCEPCRVFAAHRALRGGQ